MADEKPKPATSNEEKSTTDTKSSPSPPPRPKRKPGATLVTEEKNVTQDDSEVIRD